MTRVDIPTRVAAGSESIDDEVVRESDRVYGLLRAKIVRLELPPGSVIREAAFMRDLSVGRTPLREALQRLALDRLVVIMQRRGTFVADISIDDLRHIWEARLPLEGYSARLAAERMTKEEVRVLGKLLGRAEEVAGSGLFNAIGEADEALHVAIVRGARNPILAESVRRLYMLTQRIWYYLHARSVDKDAVMHIEWRAVVEAIKERDGNAAEIAMREHVRHSRSTVLRSI